jgi:hypothetical protein
VEASILDNYILVKMLCDTVLWSYIQSVCCWCCCYVGPVYTHSSYRADINITIIAFKYLCNLAGTDYELPEDEAIASKHVGQCNVEWYNKLLINFAFGSSSDY